ncbi:AAA domain-containing protein, putative AbiEii toxin, Type IV TA system [Aquimarina amphilecti]|uniref:AAA domain-containing protein, putative AbiEii toxin, Type IV TA system n=1 Tax=Aquimarina amphilecti TaxID=1038014 RepID=A0A1H7QLH9_AQUAM|nr:AAA family ATPase [Aquimarina amphilecti]SEL48117.1 AAA domain-containing protein, putative AbiEii toxin, Type IV TA system [Aquimarina amphilecti]
MRIKFKQPYISISKFDSIEVNDFSILTGKNGSGKTHLLNAIKHGNVEIEGIDKSEIVYYNYNDFTVFAGNLQQNPQFQNRSNLWNTEKQNFLKKIQEYKNKAIQFGIQNRTPADQIIFSFSQQPNFNFDELFGNKNDFELLEQCKKEQNILNAIRLKEKLFSPQFFQFVSQYLNQGKVSARDIKFEILQERFVDIQDSVVKQLVLNFIKQPNFNFEQYFGNEKDFELLDECKTEQNILGKIESKQQSFTPQFYQFAHQYLNGTRGNIDDFTYEKLKLVFIELQDSLDDYLNEENEGLFKFLNNTVQDKSIFNLNANDFESPNFFLEDIANEEKEYQLKKTQNSLNKIQSTEYNKKVTFLEAEEFIQKHGLSPVEQINNVLLEYDCNGYFLHTNPNQQFLGIDRKNIKVHISLIHKEKVYTTNFDQLSSGEKTLIALSLFIYKTRKNKVVPRVLLLDEVDSSLHPSMISRLLNVLENLFIEEQGFKVIMATHSPTTVALSPEDSIYIIEKNGSQIIRKEIKSNAINILTEGIATMNDEDTHVGINYNITRTALPVLFTEGITDKIILETAWTKLFENVMPFFIQDCFDASFLGNLFRRAEDTQDGIFSNYPDKTFIAMFDFDQEGYNVWNGLKKKYSIIEENPRKALTIKHNTKNAFAILLPVPENESIIKQVIKTGNETYKNESILPIELLFYGIDALKHYFKKEQIRGGGEIVVFKGKKRDFAAGLSTLNKEDFKNLLPIFEKVNEIISTNAQQFV